MLKIELLKNFASKITEGVVWGFLGLRGIILDIFYFTSIRM